MASVNLLDVAILLLLVLAGLNGYRRGAALQLSAYNRATVCWTKNGVELDPPHGERGFIIHIRPDKYPDGYAVIEVDIGDESYAQFLAAKKLDDGAAHRRKAVGKPLPPFPMPDLPDFPKVS